jgi:hypothetical protein
MSVKNINSNSIFCCQNLFQNFAREGFFFNFSLAFVTTSVADPDQKYPYVFGPPGSFYHEAKIVLKTLIPTVL